VLTDHQLDRHRNWFRIVCFAGNHTDLLMWSHYTQQHQGICIGFSVSDGAIRDPEGGKPDGGIHRVNYPDDDAIPALGGDDNNARTNSLVRALTTKSRHWAYENEYRLLSHPAHPDIMKYSTEGVPFDGLPPESLTHVYLGARISQGDQNTVIRCLLSRKHPVELYKARRHPEQFKLEFDHLGTAGANQ
jgi:hypothetical protein